VIFAAHDAHVMSKAGVSSISSQDYGLFSEGYFPP
jgi:hypothetical protein